MYGIDDDSYEIYLEDLAEEGVSLDMSLFERSHYVGETIELPSPDPLSFTGGENTVVVFAGWYEGEDFETATRIEKPSEYTITSESVMLWAKWIGEESYDPVTPESYSITYKYFIEGNVYNSFDDIPSDYGISIDSVLPETYIAGKSLNLPTPSPSTFNIDGISISFKGWYVGDSLSSAQKIESPDNYITSAEGGDITIFAKWQSILLSGGALSDFKFYTAKDVQWTPSAATNSSVKPSNNVWCWSDDDIADAYYYKFVETDETTNAGANFGNQDTTKVIPLYKVECYNSSDEVIKTEENVTIYGISYYGIMAHSSSGGSFFYTTNGWTKADSATDKKIYCNFTLVYPTSEEIQNMN